MIIRKLKYREIDVLKGFPPEEWHFDIISFMKLHFGKNYFFPLVAENSGEIVGVGNGIYTGRSAWLGNIIVREDERGRGIATRITQSLLNNLQKMNCTSFLLIATKQGEPLYRKLGFETTDHYHFFKITKPMPPPEQSHIRNIAGVNTEMLLKLDRLATSEDRQELLSEFTGKGFLFSKHDANGFYLSDFDQGLIVANKPEAGLSLLQLKVSMGTQSVVIPDKNTTALEFMVQMGYRSHGSAPRMLLGDPLNWKPEYIYSRAAGYCG
jgi:GNAT superfamily N-acetyltransferase